jgi:hypothetical protein
MHAHGMHGSDLAGIDHGAGTHSRGIVYEGFVHTQGHTGFPGGRDHLIGLGSGERHGLLHGDVLANLAGLDSHWTMQMKGGKQLHQVNFFIFQYLLIIRINLFQAPLFGFFPCCRSIAVTDRHNPRIFAPLVAHLMQPGNAAAADNGDTNRVHGSPLYKENQTDS